MRPDTEREVRILLVEDNAADVRLFREALSETPVRYYLDVVADGEEAVDFVLQRGRHAGAARPDLILLDFNLPRKTGAEVLEELKSHPAARLIPVVVLTSSRSERDVHVAYSYGANCYLRKPNTLDQIYDLVSTLSHHWFELAILPSATAEPCPIRLASDFPKQTAPGLR
jgi:CheY-like chemotaxis protein